MPSPVAIWTRQYHSSKQLCRYGLTPCVGIQLLSILCTCTLYIPPSSLFPPTSPCPQHTNCHELRVLVSLNLAISYMKVGGAKEAELAALMTSLDSEGGNMT